MKENPYVCRLKNDAQLESGKLSLLRGKMRTAAWERASQRALRDCSKETAGEGQYIRFWWRGSSRLRSTHFTKGFLLVMKIDVTMKGFSVSLDLRRHKDWDNKICSYLKTCPTRIPGAQSTTLNSLRGCWRSTAIAAWGSISCRGR